MTNKFDQEIENIKKGCEKQWLWGGRVVICGESNSYYCDTCQAKLETAQKLKIIHDKEIAELKKEELKFLENFLGHIKTIRKSVAGLSFYQVILQERISKLKQELK